jgi:vacuolar-type H+-ATPase subunit H
LALEDGGAAVRAQAPQPCCNRELNAEDFKRVGLLKRSENRRLLTMAVEALKIIREGEEEGRKVLEEAKASVSTILQNADAEIKQLKEQTREEEKRLAAEIAARYTEEGKQEEAKIMQAAEAEAEQLKATAESNLDHAIAVVLERILGLR